MDNQHEKAHVDRRSVLTTGLAAGAAVAFASGTARAATPGGQPDEAAVREIIKDWPKTAGKAADAMLKKYGPPDEATASLLIWRDNGPWTRTLVYREEVPHDFPMPHKDVLEQVIPYGVDPDMFDELAHYDGSVIVERTKGEMSARCDKEEANFLAINLANDILQGNKSVEEARQFYADTIQKLMNGETPPYTQGFQFEVPRDYKGDPGETIMQVAEKP